MKKIFDTHCHLNIEPFIDNLNELKKEISEYDIYINIVGVDKESSKIAIDLSNSTNVFATVGIHPNDCISINDNIENEKFLIEMIEKNKSKIIAIGETGLDFYRSDKNEKLEVQLDSMIRHINIAEKYNLPIVFHVRDAHDEMINFLSNKKLKTNFIIHCFSGNLDYAKKYIELGGYISFSGTITFKNSDELRDIILKIDKSKIIVETDSPFLSPEPFRGKINKPLNVKFVLDKINELLNDDLTDKIFNNAISVFNLKM